MGMDSHKRLRKIVVEYSNKYTQYLLLANVLRYVRYMLSHIRLSVCRLSVCDVGAPSAGLRWVLLMLQH